MKLPLGTGHWALGTALLCVLCGLHFGLAQQPAQVEVRPQRLPQDSGSAGLNQALKKLQTTARLLQTTAHPDDEDGAMLAYESRGQGATVMLLTLTRGDGGQNKTGSNLFDELGVLRSLELLESDRYYGAEQRFSRVADFGFTKSPDETFQKWGSHDVALADMVRVIRTFRPDVVAAGWSGTSRDGHGQHQAAGILTPEAVAAAADPKRFPEQIKEGLLPWRVKKLYARTRSDDYTLRLEAGKVDPNLGTSYAQFGIEGYSHQKSQNASFFPAQPGPNYRRYKLIEWREPRPLGRGERSESGVEGMQAAKRQENTGGSPGLQPRVSEANKQAVGSARNGASPDGAKDATASSAQEEKDFFDGIDTTLPGLASRLGKEESKVPWLRDWLKQIDAHVDEAIRTHAAAPLLTGWNKLRALLPQIERSSLTKDAKQELFQQLQTKSAQFEEATRLALGIDLQVLREGGSQLLIPGQTVRLKAKFVNQGKTAITLKDVALDLPPGWKQQVSNQKEAAHVNQPQVAHSEPLWKANSCASAAIQSRLGGTEFSVGPAFRPDSRSDEPREEWVTCKDNLSPFRGGIVLTQTRQPGPSPSRSREESTVEPGKSAAIEFSVTVPADAKLTRPYWHREEPDKQNVHTVIDAQFVTLPFPPPPITARATYEVAGAGELSAVTLNPGGHFTPESRTAGRLKIAHYEANPALRDREVVGNDTQNKTEPLQGRHPAQNLSGELHAVAGAELNGKFTPLAVVPAFSVLMKNATRVAQAGNGSPFTASVIVRSNRDQKSGGTVRLSVPEGWKTEPQSQKVDFARNGEEKIVGFTVTPLAAKEARTAIRAELESGGRKYGEGFSMVTRADLDTFYYYQPALQKISIVDVKLPTKLKIGYIMGAGDDIAAALDQLGMDVHLITPQELASGDLSQYNTIVLGIRAYDAREDVGANNRRLLDFVNQGGTLIVQYNADTEEFNSGGYAPYPLQLSRQRVSVEEAPVEMLAPDDRLFGFPNKITTRDFDGWIQERGLYFGAQWDDKYQPLLASADPTEPPLKGGLLRATYGKGTYIYTGYAFFRQIPAGVPGAIRLYVNLLSAGR